MNQFRSFCIFYLISVLYANAIENQTICESVYYVDNMILLCEHISKTDHRNSTKGIFKTCSDGSSFSNYIPRNVTENLRYFNNGFCSLGSFDHTRFFYFDFNIERFSSRSKNEVLQNRTFSRMCKLIYIDLSESGIEIIESEAFHCVESIEELLLSNNKIESLSNVVFKQMRRLKVLYLQQNRIGTFTQGTLDNLESLATLHLQENLIFYLPDDIFRQLTVLQELQLHSNKLENMSQQVLSDLTGLQILTLNNNSLKSLNNYFSNNFNLTTLSVSNNSELNLTADSFTSLGNLKDLSMDDCNLKFLPRGLFLGTPKLSTLSLSKNNIDVVTTDMFICLEMLVLLRLDSNNITRLGEPFQHNKKLDRISLRNNKLSVIEEDDLRGLSVLRHLDLSSNFIEHIAEVSFEGLSTLLDLNLSNNLITSLHGTSSFRSVLSNLTELKTLDLSNNKIKNLTNVFVNNQKLEWLTMNQNPLSLDNDSFKHTTNLNSLILEKCNITHLPSDLLKNTPQLMEVNLYGNLLKEITPDTFLNNKFLVRIDLELNNISILKDRPFKNQIGLIHLMLVKNNLTEIKKGDFEGLWSLIGLDLSWNSITKLADGSFDDMESLELLYLPHNLIFSLSAFQFFRKNIELIEIDISHNKLTDILIMDLEHLKKLELLNASNNEMTELLIPDVFPRSKKLVMHLESNKIRYIHIGSEQRRNRVEIEVYLSGNPLQCDCKEYGLHTVLKGGNLLSHVQFADGLICQSPLKNMGKKLNELQPTDFTCNITEDCPNGCFCTYMVHASTQSVNCNNENYSSLPAEAPFNTRILYIRQNSVTSLWRLNEAPWENLTELYADDNMIESEEFAIPMNLKILSLKSNKLKFLPSSVKKHMAGVNDFKIAISNNLWPCDCSVLPFKTWLSQHLNRVIDSSEVRCVFPNHSMNTLSLTMMEDSELCSPATSFFVYFVVVVIALLFTCFLVFYYKNKLYVLSFIYTHCNCFFRIFCCDRPNEEDKIFDCFISYSAEDRDVTLAILQELEEKPPHYKFCIHERNWIPGRFITNNIILSVENSRKTLIILSESFLKSPWFQLEFQAAYYQTLQDKKDRLIIVIIGNVPDKSELHEDVAFVISWKTYLLWGEKWFWQKLRYAVYEETTVTGDKNKCSLGNMFSCLFLQKNNQIQENIPMSEDLESAIKV